MEIEKPEIKKPATRGILMVAAGDKYYGSLAFHLALSLKSAEKSIPIALIAESETISLIPDEHRFVFDKIIECKPEYYSADKRDYLRTKLMMYELSPFDHTIFLDVDTVWLPYKKPSELFDMLSEVDFTFENRGHQKLSEVSDESYSMWCNIAEAKQAYELSDDKRYYSIHSEFIYFKKTKKNSEFFKLAKKIYDKPKIEVVKFANNLPDEFAFSIAVAITENYPHAEDFLPGYWYPAERNSLTPAELFNRYYFLSMGGISMPSFITQRYEDIVTVAARNNCLNYKCRFKNKHLVLTERSKI